jgi:hypothetical protein
MIRQFSYVPLLSTSERQYKMDGFYYNKFLALSHNGFPKKKAKKLWKKAKKDLKPNLQSKNVFYCGNGEYNNSILNFQKF